MQHQQVYLTKPFRGVQDTSWNKRMEQNMLIENHQHSVNHQSHPNCAHFLPQLSFLMNGYQSFFQSQMDQFQWGITHRSGLLTLNQTLLSFPWECCLGLLLNPRNIRSLYIISEMTFSTIFRDKFGQIKWGYGHLAAELLHKCWWLT